MINKFINWFFSQTNKPIIETNNIYDKLIELENRIEVLEKENIQTSNSIYEIANSLESRIDILASEPYDYNRFSLDK